MHLFRRKLLWPLRICAIALAYEKDTSCGRFDILAVGGSLELKFSREQ